MKKIEFTSQEYYSFLFLIFWLASDRFPKIVLTITLLVLIANVGLLKKSTWLIRLVFVIPIVFGLAFVVNAIVGTEDSVFDTALKSIESEGFVLTLYYLIVTYIIDGGGLTRTPKYRRFIFRDYGWEEWSRDEINSYYWKYKDLMREEEKSAIEEELMRLNRERDEKALGAFRRKTGLKEVPVIENPDKKLEYAAISAIKRGWTSVEEIRSEFGIDTKRSERILDQLQNLRICGNPREVYLTELGKDEVYYMCDIGRIGVRFKNYAMSDDEAEAIANRVVKWCDENLDKDLGKGNEDCYLSMVEKYLESKDEDMAVEKKWIVRDEVSHIFFTRELNEAVQKSESLGDYGP